MYIAFSIFVNVIITSYLLPISWTRISPVSKCIDTSTSEVSLSSFGTRTYIETLYFEDYLDYIPDQPFLALQGFSLGSSVFDFDMRLTEIDNTKYTFELDANDGCQVEMICFSALFAKDETIMVIPYDFGTHQDFNQLSSGGLAEIEYKVFYTPSNPSIFTSVTAFVSFTGIKVGSPTNSDYDFKYIMFQATSSFIRFKIKKIGDTAITRLVGNIFIVAGSAANKFGFKSSSFNQGPPIIFNGVLGGNIASNPVANTLNFYNGGPPKPLLSLRGISIGSSLPRIRVEAHHHYTNSALQYYGLATKLGGSDIQYFLYDMLLFCPDDSCLTASKNIVSAGTIPINFIGTEKSDIGPQSTTLWFALEKRLAVAPKYMAVGLSSFKCVGGCEVSLQGQSVIHLSLLYKTLAGESMSKMHTAYFVSNWGKISLYIIKNFIEGLQSYAVNFGTHPSWNSLSNSLNPRALAYTQTFNPHDDLGDSIQAFLMFFSVAFPQGDFNLDYEITSISTDTVFYKLLLSDKFAPARLKGHVVVYNGDTGLGNPYRLSINTVKTTFELYDIALKASRNSNIPLSTSYIIPPMRFAAFNKLRFGQTTTGQIDIDIRMVRNLNDCSMQVNSIETIPLTYMTLVSDYGQSGYSVLVIYPGNTGVYSPNFGVITPSEILTPGLPQVICLQNDFSGAGPYRLIITDSSEFSIAPFFRNPLGNNPRILGTYLVTKLADNVGKMTLSPWPIHVSGVISHHVLRLKSDPNWMLGGYTIDYFDSLPSTLPTSIATLGGSLPLSANSYQTMVISKFITHSSSSTFSCYLDLELMGIIRACYFDSVFILSGSSVDPSTPKVLRSASKVAFEVGDYYLLTIIALGIPSITFEFTGCTKIPSGDTFVPSFSSFNVELKMFSTDLYYNANAGSCPSNCISCFGPICLECISGKYLDRGACIDLCTHEDYLIPMRGKYCMTQQVSSALRTSSPYYYPSNKQISVNYQVETYQPVRDFILICFPYKTLYGNHANLMNSPSIPSLGEATYKLLRFSAPQSQFTLSEVVDLDVIAPNTGAQISIVGYSLNVNNILIVELAESSNSRKASKITYSTYLPSFEVEKSYIVSFYAEFTEETSITIALLGNAKIILNHCTLLFTANYQSVETYSLFRKLNGLVHFEIHLQNTQTFGLSFSSNPTFFAPYDFIFEDSTIIASDSSWNITKCLNWNKQGECLSCESGSYLINKKCTTDCSLKYEEERICRCTENSDCTLSEHSRCDISTGNCVGCVNALDCTHLFPLHDTKCLDEICYLLPRLEVSQDTDNHKIISLKFNKPMMTTTQQLAELIIITLSNNPSSDYVYAIVEIDNQTFEIRFQVKKTLNSNELTIIITNPALVLDEDQFGLVKDTYLLNIIPMQFLFDNDEDSEEDETKEDSQQKEKENMLLDDTKTLLTAIAISGLASSGALILAGTNSSFVWFFLAILQKYYYLLFLNIDYPDNFKSFLQVLTFARLDFLPNGPAIFSPDLTKQTLPSDPHFKENDMDGLFILNSGSMLTIWFVWILIAVILKLALVFLTKIMPDALFKYIRRKYKQMVWSGLMRNWMATFFDFSISASLQFKVLYWNSGVRSLSSFLALVVVTVNIIILIGDYILINISKSSPSELRRVSCLVDELKSDPEICRYYNPILLTRRLLASTIIVFCYDYPFIQIYTLIIIDSFHLLFMITKTPYKGKGEQLAILIDECLYFLIYILIAIIKSMNEAFQKENIREKRNMVGWVAIGLCLTGMFVTLVLLLTDIFSKVREFYKKYFTTKNLPKISKSNNRILKKKQNIPNGFVDQYQHRENEIKNISKKPKIIRRKTKNTIADLR